MIKRNVRYIFIVVFVICLGQIWISCKQNDDLTVGGRFTEYGTRVFSVDTFSLSLSTIIVDSIVTSNTDVALVGAHSDEITGKVTARSFFQIDLPSNKSIDEDDIYDSVALVLNYTNYYYGDTTLPFTLSVYRVENEMETHDDGYLYNTSEFKLNSVLGALTFIPRPNRGEELEIRLNDYLGMDLFDKLLNDHDSVSTSDFFLDYFKGLALVPEDDAQSILGFALDTSMVLRIYGHRMEEELEEWELDFPIIENSLRFNQITKDKAGNSLDNLETQKDEVNSSLTNNLAFVKGGVGLMTKISFPYIRKLLEIIEYQHFRIELILHPVITDSNSVFFPSDFILYDLKKYNVFESVLQDDEGNNYSGTVIRDYDYNETSIIFDITDYIEYKINYYDFDEEIALAVSYEDPVFEESCNQVEIGGFENLKYKPELKIYFLDYEYK